MLAWWVYLLYWCCERVTTASGRAVWPDWKQHNVRTARTDRTVRRDPSSTANEKQVLHDRKLWQTSLCFCLYSTLWLCGVMELSPHNLYTPLLILSWGAPRSVHTPHFYHLYMGSRSLFPGCQREGLLEVRSPEVFLEFKPDSLCANNIYFLAKLSNMCEIFFSCEKKQWN